MASVHRLVSTLWVFWAAGGAACLGDDRGHWAFVPPRRPEIPRVKEASWIRNPIDAFILVPLERRDLRHAPEASRPTLLRRLSFDLTGLPPTPDELDAFVADQSPLAYERVVDRLLASPHYGERWGQHWLDLARFAETDGFEFDQARPNAWRYRDWVVQTLNDDLPYDAFVRLQLAGDEVQPGDATAFIATGFNRCYPDMVDLNDQGLRRQNALNDITETTALVFLGLTIGCARCHDHKFDPIPQSDFYRLQAFFAGARFRDDYVLASAAERLESGKRLTDWQRQVTSLRAALIGLEAPYRMAIAPGEPPGVNDETAAAFQKPAAERSARDVDLVFEAMSRDRRIRGDSWLVVLDPTTRMVRSFLRARLDRLVRMAPPELPKARGLDEAGPIAPPTFLLRRGEYSARGPEVGPAFPSVLCSGDSERMARPRPSPRSTGRRSSLADWLVQPDHPLTARVMVNRLWQHHFGRGIVATPSDFGTMGEEPSHPELLDWLATELISRGWRLKAMHRLIVTSATYRQSSLGDRSTSSADPENSLIGRQNRRRLDGEAIRDALLAISGRLDQAIGGPSVFPELPAELKRLSSKGAVWPVTPRAGDQERRSLYVFVRRNLRFPFFEVFDRPDTNASCPQRAVTTIAPQALTLLNSQLAHESARALAGRAGRTDHPGTIERVSRIALGRAPDASERRILREFLRRGGSLTDLCLGLINANEFIYID
jgi:hypothetical protein